MVKECKRNFSIKIYTLVNRNKTFKHISHNIIKRATVSNKPLSEVHQSHSLFFFPEFKGYNSSLVSLVLKSNSAHKKSYSVYDLKFNAVKL